MAEVIRTSRIAVVEESTAGTPLAPSSGAQFVGAQEGFEFSPEFDTQESAELSSSVGAKAPILGIEQPTASLSHYIRHSGVEATAPNYDQLIKSAIGDRVAAAAEVLTAAASTAGSSSAAAVLKLVSGTNAERGKAYLIKDPTNGYNIRNAQSVSTNDVTLGFNLAAAPAAGVATGRSILYKPADTLPSNSLWGYISNGAAVELMAGARCTEMSIEANTGELLNGSFSFAGTGYYFDPIQIASTDAKLDFNETGPTLRAATIPVKMYKDPHELAAAIQSAMNDVATDAITVTYSDSTGKYTITSAGTLLELLWNTGTNTANTIGDKIGFSTAADDTAALTYTSDNAVSWASPYTPTADSNINPLAVKYSEVMLGTFADYGCAGAQNFTLTVSNELQDVLDICAESGVAAKLLSQRIVTIETTLTLSKNDAIKFTKFRQGDDVRFAFTGGIKSGGNWVAGRCVNFYLPQCKISSFQRSESDGIVTMDLTLQAYVGSDGLGEVYVNFL